MAKSVWTLKNSRHMLLTGRWAAANRLRASAPLVSTCRRDFSSPSDAGASWGPALMPGDKVWLQVGAPLHPRGAGGGSGSGKYLCILQHLNQGLRRNQEKQLKGKSKHCGNHCPDSLTGASMTEIKQLIDIFFNIFQPAERARRLVYPGHSSPGDFQGRVGCSLTGF